MVGVGIIGMGILGICDQRTKRQNNKSFVFKLKYPICNATIDNRLNIQILRQYAERWLHLQYMHLHFIKDIELFF